MVSQWYHQNWHKLMSCGTVQLSHQSGQREVALIPEYGYHQTVSVDEVGSKGMLASPGTPLIHNN